MKSVIFFLKSNHLYAETNNFFGRSTTKSIFIVKSIVLKNIQLSFYVKIFKNNRIFK